MPRSPQGQQTSLAATATGRAQRTTTHSGRGKPEDKIIIQCSTLLQYAERYQRLPAVVLVDCCVVVLYMGMSWTKRTTVRLPWISERERERERKASLNSPLAASPTGERGWGKVGCGHSTRLYNRF